jgi:hypothetical protein
MGCWRAGQGFRLMQKDRVAAAALAFLQSSQLPLLGADVPIDHWPSGTCLQGLARTWSLLLQP